MWRKRSAICWKTPARHSQAEVWVTVAPALARREPMRRGAAGSRSLSRTTGRGLNPDEIKEALKRGRRLDESKPGTGLGLSIVGEVTREYQGKFELTRGSGGLKAILTLPGTAKGGGLSRVLCLSVKKCPGRSLGPLLGIFAPNLRDRFVQHDNHLDLSPTNR